MTYATITTTQEILKTVEISDENYSQQPLFVTILSQKVSKARKAN